MNLGDIIQSRRNGYTQGFQQRFVYNANGLVEYMGVAQRGVPTSAVGWMIIRFTYDASNNIETITMGPKNAAFDDYATLTYA